MYVLIDGDAQRNALEGNMINALDSAGFPLMSRYDVHSVRKK